MQWRGQAAGLLDVVFVLFMGCARLGGGGGRGNEVRLGMQEGRKRMEQCRNS